MTALTTRQDSDAEYMDTAHAVGKSTFESLLMFMLSAIVDIHET